MRQLLPCPQALVVLASAVSLCVRGLGTHYIYLHDPLWGKVCLVRVGFGTQRASRNQLMASPEGPRKRHRVLTARTLPAPFFIVKGHRGQQHKLCPEHPGQFDSMRLSDLTKQRLSFQTPSSFCRHNNVVDATVRNAGL